MNMSNESTETFELSEQDKADLEALGAFEGEGPSYHPLLQVWDEILKPAAKEAEGPVTPQWASRMIQSYSEVSFSDMGELHSRFYKKIEELHDILRFEISTDDEALNRTDLETDREENREHYLNLLLNWQKAVLQWELDWDFADPFAGVELAAISEVHKMFFSEQGLVAFLENIQFEYDEGDAQMLTDALEEMKAGHE